MTSNAPTAAFAPSASAPALESLRAQVEGARAAYRAANTRWNSLHGSQRAAAWKVRQNLQDRYFNLQRALFIAEDGSHDFRAVNGSPDLRCLCGASLTGGAR